MKENSLIANQPEEQVEVLKELVTWAKETNAVLLVLRSGIHALISTHQDPASLASAYQDQMNLLADSVRPERIELYRQEAQLLQDSILAAVNKRQS